MAVSTQSENNKTELRILTPIGMLGQGFSEDVFWRGIENGVDAMILDSGSTDSGPGKLAMGSTSVPRIKYERDLAILVKACHSHRIPLLIGSAGGDGENKHVDMFVDIIAKLVSENGYRSMNVVTIYSEIPKDLVRQKLDCGLISPCGGGVPQMLETDITSSTRIVAQMGHEPYVKAMLENPDFDIIIGGVNYAMGKIMECGAVCSTPKSREALATVRHDSFDVVALDPKSRCTVTSVAAHFLYEKTRPDILHGPGGALLLADTTYEQMDYQTVRVRGAKFEPEQQGEYTLKLEGARTAGYQTVLIGAIRDPILISQLDNFFSKVESYVRDLAPGVDHDLKIHRYGQNGVMGLLEPDTSVPKEVCLCIQVRAATQADANQIASITKFAITHSPYPGQVATAGNFAWPVTPCENPLGPITEFCIYHIMHKSDPLAHFAIKVWRLEGDGSHIPQTWVPELKNNVLVSQNAVAKAPISKMYYLTPEPAPGTCYLADLASIIRSKNAGPYELTFDVMFDDREIYQKVKVSGILTQAVIAKLYQIPEMDVIASLFWDQAMAYKATIVRPLVSGSFGETDTHGSQQHAPLLYLTLPFGREQHVHQAEASVQSTSAPLGMTNDIDTTHEIVASNGTGATDETCNSEDPLATFASAPELKPRNGDVIPDAPPDHVAVRMPEGGILSI